MISQYKFSDQVTISKSDLRDRMRQVRQHLDADSRAAGSQFIGDKLHHIIVEMDARKVGLYLATAYEVNLDSVIDQCVREEREIYLPHLEELNVPFRRFDEWEKVQMGPLNLRHPSVDASALMVEDFDVIVLPGLAFDRLGNRLGHGGGWYDRALSRLDQSAKKPVLLGVCFDEQLIKNMPTESFDVRMNIVVTPTTLYRQH